MITVEDIPSAIAALRTFERDMPAEAAEPLRKAMHEATMALSPVDAIVKAAEALYANLPDLDQGGKELCSALSGFATGMGWHGLAGDGRGMGMVKAALREAGVKIPGMAQKAEDDPAPKSEYLAAAPAAADIPPAPPAPVS